MRLQTRKKAALVDMITEAIKDANKAMSCEGDCPELQSQTPEGLVITQDFRKMAFFPDGVLPSLAQG